MIDAVATQNELNEIAQCIDIGNAEHADPLAQRLRDLGAAVVGGDYFDAWAAVDVHRLIEPDIIVQRFSLRLAYNKWIVRLQWTRNVLIFLLVLFTLACAALAFHAYNALGNGAARESFFYLWLHGFLWQWFTPYFLVGGDLLFFISIMLVVGFSTWYNQRSHILSALAGERLRVRLARVLADASLCLATGRWQAPTNLVNRFDIIAHKLEQEMQEERLRLSELANRREKEFADLAAFSTGVAGVTNGMLTAANTLNETTSGLLSGLRAFSEQYRDVPQQQQKLLATMNTTIQLLQDAINLLGGVEGRQERRIEELSSTLVRLEETVGHMMEAVAVQQRQIEEYTGQQHNFYQNIQDERELQNKVVQRVINATETVGKALEEINKDANSMHIIAVDFNKVRTQLEGLLNAIKNDFFVEMKGAADQISNGGLSLASAAATIEQASQSLTHMVVLLGKAADSSSVAGADDEFITHAVTSKLEEPRAHAEDHRTESN